jgi:hypothetical protein
MKRVMVRYKVKPDRAVRNEELVRAVYAELHEREPSGIRYATFKLDDGLTFVHLAETDVDPAPLTGLRAFNEFLAGIDERCDDPPVVTELHEIGSFHLFTA